MELDGTRVLALGTRGAQGAGLVDALRERGATPVRTSTDPAQVGAWRTEGADAATADLADPASVVRAAREVGAAAVALHVPLGLGSPDGVRNVATSVAALRDAGLPVAVNVGTPVPPEQAPDPMGARATAAALLGTGAAVVSPTAYLENHAAPWALGPLGEGRLLYPCPAGDPLRWVAAADVAKAVVAALALDLGGDLLHVAGPEELTFDQLAHELGAGMGRSVVFERVPPTAYADLLRPYLGPAADGVGAAYAGMPEEPNPVMRRDATQTWQRLGLEPRTAREWAASMLRPRLLAA